MPVMSFAVVTNGPAATAGSTPMRFKIIGITVAMLVETRKAVMSDTPTTMPRNTWCHNQPTTVNIRLQTIPIRNAILTSRKKIFQTSVSSTIPVASPNDQRG